MSTAETTAAASTLIYEPRSYVERLDLAQLFAKAQPLEVELGCGDGTFLVEWARLHPEHNFIGVERLLGRLRKVDRKGRRLGLTNLRAVRLEASYFTEYLLAFESVSALHVYFPDPWPKRKHWKHRLVNEHFVEVTAKVLAPGGVIYLRTDSTDYFTQMSNVFTASPRFQPTDTPAGLRELLTDFERDFHSKGVSTLRAAYRVTGDV
jgi:tRNA (guanine-N7-)-methyltransferase